MIHPLSVRSDLAWFGLRWIARVLSLAVVGLVLLIFVGEGFNPLRLTAHEAVLMVCFWTAIAGLLVAWKREGLGGTLTVGGMLLFYGFHRLTSGVFPRGWAFVVIALPGLFFLCCAAWERKSVRRVEG